MDANTTAGGIIREAASIVDGARNQAHGDKERSFIAIAELWNAYLVSALDARPERVIQPRDVAAMMVLMKMARALHGDASHRDHYVDMVGYSGIMGELALPKVKVEFPENYLVVRCTGTGALKPENTPRKGDPFFDATNAPAPNPVPTARDLQRMEDQMRELWDMPTSQRCPDPNDTVPIYVRMGQTPLGCVLVPKGSNVAQTMEIVRAHPDTGKHFDPNKRYFVADFTPRSKRLLVLDTGYTISPEFGQKGEDA